MKHVNNSTISMSDTITGTDPNGLDTCNMPNEKVEKESDKLNESNQSATNCTTTIQTDFDKVAVSMDDTIADSNDTTGTMISADTMNECSTSSDPDAIISTSTNATSKPLVIPSDQELLKHHHSNQCSVPVSTTIADQPQSQSQSQSQSQINSNTSNRNVPSTDSSATATVTVTSAATNNSNNGGNEKDNTSANNKQNKNESGDTVMETIVSITQRLLVLRGSPPGTLVSLAESEIRLICQCIRPVLLSQPMLLELEAPLKICGDVHGQFTDLLRLFEYGGFPPASNYLFLGDYVDRGKQSLETICLLFCYKIQYPENFFILRGNHESAGINRIYGFYDECKRRYSIKLWKIFSDVFNCLPVSALVDEKILCMHGGLSPEMESLQQIADLQRPCDVPDVGLMCDLLWSDPDTGIHGWAENDRGVSFVFGADVVAAFLEKHDLDLLVRAHQVVEDGYEFFAGRRLVTLFSAPNYCGEFDNAGGMISVDEVLMCSFQILKPSARSTRFPNNSNRPMAQQPQSNQTQTQPVIATNNDNQQNENNMDVSMTDTPNHNSLTPFNTPTNLNT
mmetsp:Transcript_15760/g.22412  ORF Transcript_15760/g.22412 Transcript_15760/m.22412 type:complete len:566 (-) Transcript_15760:114-1811(-)